MNRSFRMQLGTGNSSNVRKKQKPKDRNFGKLLNKFKLRRTLNLEQRLLQFSSFKYIEKTFTATKFLARERPLS